MLNDNELVDLSYEIDNTLALLLEKHQIGPLSLSAIILARLMRMTEEVDADGDFKKIMKSASTHVAEVPKDLH